MRSIPGRCYEYLNSDGDATIWLVFLVSHVVPEEGLEAGRGAVGRARHEDQRRGGVICGGATLAEATM